MVVQRRLCVMCGCVSLQDVVLESLWRDQRCVVMFFRRFACPYCRMDAVHLSKLKPQLDQANVRLVGIGHEKAGLEDFQKQEFFKGGLSLSLSFLFLSCLLKGQDQSVLLMLAKSLGGIYIPTKMQIASTYQLACLALHFLKKYSS